MSNFKTYVTASRVQPGHTTSVGTVLAVDDMRLILARTEDLHTNIVNIPVRDPEHAYCTVGHVVNLMLDMGDAPLKLFVEYVVDIDQLSEEDVNGLNTGSVIGCLAYNYTDEDGFHSIEAVDLYAADSEGLTIPWEKAGSDVTYHFAK